MISMKQSSYGYDVLCLVGEMRFGQHMTVSEIHHTLNERGERYAQELYERFQVLLASSLDDHVKLVVEETVVASGVIM